jgi:TRAP-type uncharacterized transport system fused permease subunit
MKNYQSQTLIARHVDDAYQRGFQVGVTIGMVCATIGCAIGVILFTYVKG